MGVQEAAWCVISYVTSPRHPSVQGVPMTRSVSMPSSSSSAPTVSRTSVRSGASLVLSKVRAVARQLLTLEERDPQRVFQGQALMRRMIRYGILDEDKQRLDYVLALKIG